LRDRSSPGRLQGQDRRKVQQLIFTEEVSGGVAVVTIDHPPVNLVDGTFVAALIELLDRREADPDVRVLVFRSADRDYFLMHGDVDLIRVLPHTPYEPVTEPHFVATLFDRLSTGRLVTIGLVDGIARGGGCEFLSALDMRFGTSNVLIGQPEVALGLVPGTGGTVRWPRLVGRGRALDILLTARDMNAHEALASGWLDRLVEPSELDEVGIEAARRIAAMSPACVDGIKRIVDQSLGDRHTALVAEADVLAQRMADDEHRIAIGRFLAAGGQTRNGERHRMKEIMAAVIRNP
jgi:enoyl-CoA hydratase/carnithine racemase